MAWVDEKTAKPRLEITDAALAIYAEMRTLRCQCAPRPEDMAYWDAPPECDGCIEWALLNRRLAPLVGLPLHEVHAVPPPSGESFLREPEEARRLALEEALAGRGGQNARMRQARQ
jgi:hypothetical protein